MLAEVAAAISAVKAINDSIAAIKEAGQNASGLGVLIEKFASANDAVQKAETKHAGKLSVAESAQIQIAKKRLLTFNQQLKDLMLMQGLSSDYAQIMQRVEDSKIAHEREVARIKKKRAEFRKMLNLGGSVVFLWVALMGVIWLFATIYSGIE